MNADQIASLTRSLMKVLAGLLAAHGLTDAAGVLNTPDVISAVLLIVSLAWSHFSHSSPPGDAGGSSTPGGKAVLLALCAAGFLLPLVGCKTTPQAATYQAAGSTAVSVQAALAAYDAFAAAGKTSPAQNAQVKAAFEKYKIAFAVVCDAGAVYAASSGTNAPAASLALEQAISGANQSIADLVNLIQSFGVKLN